ncbi:MAG: hypothetical protein C0392_06000 [Syntrophus sp. (in: bacteria)]|nr:hypothetical protein [Syntrophus sp. (in: bacteria)]
MEFNEILLIHLGGLGDMCLAESTFHSLSLHFKEPIVAVGTKRFFNLFKGYFDRVHGIESARWLYLFSDQPSDITWERIIFIGKDREGNLRAQWQRLSRSPLIFVDMYPEYAFDHSLLPASLRENTGKDADAKSHIEGYQLAQLPYLGIKPLKKEVPLRPSERVILYPEKGFEKEKWHYNNFIELYHSLKSKCIKVYVLESFGLDLDLPEKVILPELKDVREFFEEGGVFVSNDSGIAHLAGACGLYTITIFTDFDPHVWRPRGANISLKYGKDRVDVPSLEETIICNLCSSLRCNPYVVKQHAGRID